MNAKEMAEKLHGIEYLDIAKMDVKEFKIAKEHGFVIVFGMSDDLVEFEGAIYDEADCYGGKELFFNKTGLVEKDTAGAIRINALWGKDKDYCWIFKTDFEHECFDILDSRRDSDMKYCKGIVFHISDVEKG